MEANDTKREKRGNDVVSDNVIAAKFTRMLYPIPSVLVTLPEYSCTVCEDFAHHCYETNKEEYYKRQQSDPVKIKRQIVTGKLGELAIYYYLTRYSSNFTSEVDFLIYGKTQKTYEPDIYNNGHGIHVKSVLANQANQYGLAWLMQKSDPLFQKSFEEKKLHKIAMCQVLDRRNIMVHGFIGANHIITGEPHIARLRESKIALWFDKQPTNKIKLTL